MKTSKAQSAVLTVWIMLLIACTPSEPDTVDPEITIIYPPNNVVVGDSVTMQVTASDNETITRIEYYVDDIQDSLADDHTRPFEYTWNPKEENIPIGTRHKLYAKAVDEMENEMISDLIFVRYKWMMLTEDVDEPFRRDIEKVYIRNTEERLEFLVQTYEDWGAPYDPDRRGVNFAIFLDTDSDTATGLSPSTPVTTETTYLADSLQYAVDGIGPDYLIVVGVEGDGLWKWNPDSSKWGYQADLDYLDLKSSTNTTQFGINYADIGTPAMLKVVSCNHSFGADTTFWDWAPDFGHTEYHKDDATFIGPSEY